MKKPNILFLFSDQQRWDTVGCYGQKLNVTPNLDNMANDGVRFEYAFSCQPVCGPARACLQTGRYATETGCYRNNIALPSDEKTIAKYLSNAGYEVGYIGKWHLASQKDQGIDFKDTPVPPERRGGYKDYWMAADKLEFTSHGYDGFLFDTEMKKAEFKGYRVDCITDYVIDYLRSRKGDRPFFLFTSYIEPHHQNDRKKYEGPEGSKERFKNFEVPGDLIGTQGDWRENFPDYLGCCASLDFNVGRIRAVLKELHLSDNTVIFYTSDHGSHFRTRNQEYKRSCHESSVRIPLLVHGPGFTGGKVVSELVSLINLPATILACAGIKKPEQMRGYPLQQLLEGNAVNWPQDVFIQISESHVGRALRTKHWKYSICAPGKDGHSDSCSDTYVEDFLYDLENDPYEINNLVRQPEYNDVRAILRDMLKVRIKEAGEAVPQILCQDIE